MYNAFETCKSLDGSKHRDQWKLAELATAVVSSCGRKITRGIAMKIHAHTQIIERTEVISASTNRSTLAIRCKSEIYRLAGWLSDAVSGAIVD